LKIVILCTGTAKNRHFSPGFVVAILAVVNVVRGILKILGIEGWKLGDFF
jgi:hypothetical protein